MPEGPGEKAKTAITEPATSTVAVNHAPGGGAGSQFQTTVEGRMTFRGCPVCGPLRAMATAPFKLVVVLDWDLKPSEVLLVDSLERLHDNWFSPNDNGSEAFIAFGPSPDPKRSALIPIYACCKYDGAPIFGETPDMKAPSTC